MENKIQTFITRLVLGFFILILSIGVGVKFWEYIEHSFPMIFFFSVMVYVPGGWVVYTLDRFIEFLRDRRIDKLENNY
jgi:hypothetical protein